MKIISQLLVWMLFVVAVCHAQEKCKVEGSVKDLSGPAISGVTITVKSSLGTGTARTGKDGKYSLQVLCTETSKHTVAATKAGYVFDPASRPWEKYSAGPSFTGRTNK